MFFFLTTTDSLPLRLFRFVLYVYGFLRGMEIYFLQFDKFIKSYKYTSSTQGVQWVYTVQQNYISLSSSGERVAHFLSRMRTDGNWYQLGQNNVW